MGGVPTSAGKIPNSFTLYAKGVKNMRKRNEDELEKFRDAALYAIINCGVAAEDLRQMEKIAEIVKSSHKYSIYKNEGRWFTRIKLKNGKVTKIAKTDYNELIEALYAHYHGPEKTLRSLYPEWLEYKKLQAASDSYPLRIQSDWRKFYENDPIVDLPLLQLTPIALKKFALKKIKEYELTKTAYYNMTLILRQALAYAVEIGELSRNPFDGVEIDTRRLLRRPQKKADEEQVFTSQEIEEFWKLAWEDFETPGRKVYRLAPLAALFALFSGVRVGELTGLKFEDLDGAEINIRRMVRKDDHVVIDHAKTAAGERTIPLTKRALVIIEAARNFPHEGDWIFSEHERPLPSRIVEEYYRRYCQEIGTPIKTPHCARKTFTSALIDGGVNINTVRQVVGHADERTTYRNYVYDRSTRRERFDRIEQALNYSSTLEKTP